jgi:hypothetical protein
MYEVREDPRLPLAVMGVATRYRAWDEWLAADATRHPELPPGPGWLGAVAVLESVAELQAVLEELPTP